MKLCFATNNSNKLAEISKLLGDTIELVGLKEIGCTEELLEEQDTLAGNSLQKAQYVFDRYGINCFADDTGLMVEALNGAPGVYSARYAGSDCDANKNMDLLLKNMGGVQNRNARFVTMITLIIDQKRYVFEGEVKGTIRTEKVGAKGFGYDPIFEPEGYSLTFAEMTMDEKNKISHRAKAVEKLVQFLHSYTF